ncbi:MAG: hypothetical protein JJU03_09475 [Idiomarina sp.]|nr:hypothetical protein [Idiomarina sp.]
MTLPWLRPTWLQLISSAQQGRLGHAIGLPWLPELGTDKLAEHLSQWLLCQAPNKGSKACGRCKSCLLVHAQHHPDFLRLGEDSESSIGVDSVRQLQQRLSNTAHQGGHKVVLLANAHNMTVAAANALLKTLEEPPRDSTIVLATNRWDSLLPTVRSRLQHYQVHAPGVETLAQWLTQHAQTPVQTSESLRLWCQRPLRALEALQQGQDLSASPLEAVLGLQPLAKSTNQAADVIALLDEFETLLRDALWLSMQGAAQQCRAPQLVEAAGLQRALSLEMIAVADIEQALTECQQVRQHLRTGRGLNPQLALQRVITPFLAKLQPAATAQA